MSSPEYTDMLNLSRTAGAVALLLGAGAALPALDPAAAKAAGLDYWNAAALRRELADSADESVRLETTLANTRVKQAVKARMIVELIDGRTTLAAVTGEFLALADSDPEYLFAVRHDSPGVADREAVARNVVACALTVFGDPAREDDLRQRLESDLRAMFDAPAGDGAVAARTTAVGE